jgi:hypothetical protein
VVKPLDSLVAIRATHDREGVREAIRAFTGRKGDYTPRTPFEQQYFAGDPARVRAARGQVATSALTALARHLGGLTARRKALIVVSEGLPPGTAGRRRGALPSIDSLVRTAARAHVAIYPIDPRGTAGDASGGRLPRAARVRSAAAIGPAIEQGTTDEPEGRDVLRRLAADTGGLPVFSATELRARLRRVAADTLRYYEVAFAGEIDGRFHQLDVRVARAGIELLAPRGYWAASAAEVARAAAAARPPARKPRPLARRTSPLIRPWFGVARAEDGLTRVSFVWEPAPGVAGGPAAAAEPAEIAMTAALPDGTPVFEGMVQPSGAPARPDATVEARFDAPPGPLHVRLIIQDATSKFLDTDARELQVDALSDPVAIGTPRVLRARTARERRALESVPLAPPSPARTFSRAERLLIRVPVYTAEGTAPRVTAALSSRIGGHMRPLPVSRLDDADLHIEVRLAGLAAGDYAVQLEATSGDATAREVVPFRVVP